ncbi:LOW QUALITY PROTEIN: titin homolog [Culicoides brevitarsis]|uniref:LOW QUALITY PROTEIN: titin homolog n=1 Tax=Culicoides brevitarsis TaxID=469753 RepID=UPI00307BA0B8
MVHRRSSSNNNLETNCIVEANNHENVSEGKTSESANVQPNKSNEQSSNLEDESTNDGNKKTDEINKSSNKKSCSPKNNNIKDAATNITTKNSHKTRLNAEHESSASTNSKNGTTNDELEKETQERKSSSTMDRGDREDIVTPKKEEDIDDSNTSLISSSKGIICSLPLERLSGILGSLTQSKENSNKSILDVQNHNKILCLYCDRTFSSQKLHIKHTERAHKQSEGRRSSIRNTNTSNNNGISSSSPTSSTADAFSGCSFCTSNKLSPMVADDLDVLFNHIVEAHNDKYFACRECTTRFVNEDNLNNHLKNVHNQEIPQKRPSLPVTKPLSVIVDFEDEIIARMQASKRDMDDVRLTRNAAKSMQDSHLSAKEQMLMRLGIAQHRSPRTRKGAKNRRGAPSESTPRSETYRPSRSRSGRTSATNLNASESNEFVIQRTKNEVLNCTFDEDFYETVSNNVRLNLSCHLDGKLNSNPTEPSPLSPVAVCPTVRSTVVHNPQVTDSEIHEATSLSTNTAFPTLLTADQYGKSVSASNKYKKPMTKNSWKWKWDLVKKYKYVNEGGKIVKKVKQPTSGLRDLSKLDMWTQLVMRKKHEDLLATKESDTSSKDEANCAVRTEKRRIVEQLNCILDKRLLPQINVEQDEQRVIKKDPDEDEPKEQPSTSFASKKEDKDYIPEILKLLPSQQTTKSKLILSGEWARPRCYICFCCGAKFDTIKHLEEHKSGRHPHTSCTHYEVVGRELIEKQFFNNFYLPTKALELNDLIKHGPVNVTENEIVARLKEKETAISVEDSMDSVTSTSVSVVTTNTTETDSNTKSSSKTCTTSSSSVQQSPLKSACSKCNKDTNSLLDLHRHMLDCSGDYAWAQVKKRLKYRRLLGKKRRVVRGMNVVRRPKSTSKTDDDKEDEKEDTESPKPKPPPTPKVRPSDAESIQRMLENLPPKRTCRQILSLNNQTIRRKIQSKAMQPQITLKKEDFDSTKVQNNKKSDSSQKTERKSLRSSASSTSSGSSKETTPVKDVSPSNSNQKKGFMKQVHAKAKSVIRNLSKTFSKSPTKRNTRSSNNNSPEMIKDEEEKTPEIQEKESTKEKESSKEKESTKEKENVEGSVNVKNVEAKDEEPNTEESRDVLSDKKETKVKDSSSDKIDTTSTNNDQSKKKDEETAVQEEEKESESKTDHKKEEVVQDSVQKTDEAIEKAPLTTESVIEPKVPEITSVNKDENSKNLPANRRSNRRKGQARKSICSVEKDFENEFTEEKQPAIQTTSSKINPEPKILPQKNVINLSLENVPPKIPANTQLTITVSPQPGSSSSLLTPISGPNTNVAETSFTPLASPALRTSTENLLKTPPGKRKPKKLTDCIAMLTGKLQHQQPSPVIEPSPIVESSTALEPISPPILSPAHKEVPKMIVTQVEPMHNDPEPELEAMDLSAKSRPKSPNQAPITWTADGVLDLSKKPAIRHSVENMISPVSHRSSMSPSFMSPPPPQITEPYVTNKHQSFNSSFSYSLPNLTPPVSDYSKNQSSSSSNKRKSSTPKVKEPEILNYEMPSMMGSPPLDLPPAAVLSMIGLGVPAITIPLPLPLPFQPPPPMNLIDFGPQQTSTPLVLPEISTPSNSSRSSSSRRSKPKPRNLRNETEVHENKNRSVEIPSVSDQKTPGTKYSSIDTIVDSIEAVIKQSAIEAESSQKCDASIVQFYEASSVSKNKSKSIEQTKSNNVEIQKPSETENVAEVKETNKVEQSEKEQKTDSVEKATSDTTKTDKTEENKEPKVTTSNESKSKKSGKTNKEQIKPTQNAETPAHIISKDTDFEELIDQVRSPPSGEGLNKTDDEKDMPTEKPTEEDNVKASKAKAKKGGKKKVSIESPKKDKSLNEEPKKKDSITEKTTKSTVVEDIANHNIEEKEELVEKEVATKKSKEANDSKKNKNNTTTRKTVENKPLDDIQLARIGYRRKSIRLLGIDPDLTKFDDEPADEPEPKPDKVSKKKSSSNLVEKESEQRQEETENLSIPEPEVRKSPRRSQRQEKPAPSPVVEALDNPSDDEPLSKKVTSMEKIKKSPTKKMPPKKRDSARKIVDSPLPDTVMEVTTPLNNKVEPITMETNEMKENSDVSDKKRVQAKSKKVKGKVEDTKPLEKENNESINVEEKPSDDSVAKEVKKINKRKTKTSKEDSSKIDDKNVEKLPENIEEEKPEDIPKESHDLKEDDKDIESDKLIDNESLKENQLKTVQKARKKRKNELAAIIADQLLESFKEVDNSRKDELKILHDLSCEKNENNDELLVSAIRTTPVPRRKAAAKAKDAMESESESRITSPIRKKVEQTPNENIKKKSKEEKDSKELLKEEKQVEEKIVEAKPEEEVVKSCDDKPSVSETIEKIEDKQKDVNDKPPANKKAKINNLKKKFVPPPVSIPTFIDDEEISFKRTTRKQFAQEIAILNQMKQVANKSEPTQVAKVNEPEVRTVIEENTTEVVPNTELKETTNTVKKAEKKEKQKPSTVSVLDNSKSDPDDDISLSELSGRPTIRTRKLSIELEDISVIHEKKKLEEKLIDESAKIVNDTKTSKKIKTKVNNKKSNLKEKDEIESSITVQENKNSKLNNQKESKKEEKLVHKVVNDEHKSEKSAPTNITKCVEKNDLEISKEKVVNNLHNKSKDLPSVDLDITESLEKLDKTKKATERNAILSDLFDHLKDDVKKSNDADSSGFETDISKNSSNVSTKVKQSKNSKKSSSNKKNAQKEESNAEKLKLHLDSANGASVDKMAALNIFCKGLNIPIVEMTDPHSTPISPTNSSNRSVFLRPSALDKVLDNKNEIEASKASLEQESPKKSVEPKRTSLRNKRSSIDTPPAETTKTPKRRNSVRLEKETKLKSPKLSDLIENSRDSDLYTPSFNEIGFNDDELDESSLKINEIVNNLINTAELSESDDEKLPLTQKPSKTTNKKRVSIEEVPTTIFTDKNESVSDYEDNGNADALDMDMDDDCSVITDYTICRNESEGKIGSRIPRKRKYRKSVLYKKRKAVRKESTETNEEFNCNICKKTFKKADGLSKHKTTLSHIAKLSEIEYLMAQKEKENAELEKPVHRELTPEPKQSVKDMLLNERPESPIISKPNTPDILIPGYSPTSSPMRRISRSPMRSILSPGGIEPISSPEHIEPNYDRQNSLIRKAPDNSRVQLNSEERLFYEVCSMLKSTKSSKSASHFSSVVKGNESNFANTQHHIGYSVKSPPTHSRSSPKAAFPKSDINQFSDISSDSNPNAFRRQGRSSKGKTFANYVSQNHLDSAAMENKNAIMREEFYDSFSDMGDSFQSSHNDSDNEIIPSKKHFGSTLLDKRPSNNQKFIDSDKESPISSPNLETKGANAVYASSLHSTASSRNSNISKIKTKAAMKGFDNFKVSIPTTGLDMDNVKKGDPIPNTLNLKINSSKKAKKSKEKPPAKRMFKTKAQKPKTVKSTQNNKNSSVADSTSKDIYAFDDSQDSADKPLKDTFRAKPPKASSKPASEIDKITDTPVKPSTIVQNEESQQSSTSFSDRDDFVYGDNNPDSSVSSSESSSDSFTSINTKTKEPKKPDPANLQKKSLMMAKIFSKKKDNGPKPKVPEAKNTSAKPKIDRDKLFDILKAENERKQEAKKISDGKSLSFDTKNDKRSLSPDSKKSHEIANIEAEWGMSMKQIEELIGVGNRKPKRRCATNRPKNLVETWSSDEYEEFHTTKDIIALIEDAEKKAQRKIRSSSKNNEPATPTANAFEPVANETKEVSFDKLPEPNKKKVTIMAMSEDEGKASEKAKKSAPKKKVTIAKPDKSETKPKSRGRKKQTTSNKPKNVAYDSDSDFEHHLKPSVKKTATIKQRRTTIAAPPPPSDSESDDSIKTLPAKVWNAKNKEKLKVIQKSKEAEDTKPIGRRKRVASEMLYYWSSSSSDDDEFGKISAPVKNPDEDDSLDSDDHQQQHGWIVGDSHKKLVTLLAHAKAKKVDDHGSSSGGKKK